VHIRTPIVVGLIVLLVVLLSAFCYYRAVAPTRPQVELGTA
jgi:hypothetical protein